jgi:hypothetical protein
MCLVCFPDSVTRCPQARIVRGVPPPPEKVAPMMSPICHPNRKTHLHMLVVHMILIWKMLIWSLILMYIKDRSRNGPATHIKRLSRFVIMNMKRTPLLHNFGLRYNMMLFMATYSKSLYLLISQLIGII